MKNKLFKVSFIALAIILLLQVAVFAAVEKLTFKTTTEKDFYSVGDKVTVTVDWTEGMQAAVFKVNYDAEKLTFDKASVAASYYNTETKGVISVQWASLEEEDLTKMTFEFTAKAAGKATFSIADAKFMDGNLERPSSYDVATSGTKEITIVEKVEEKPETEQQPEQTPSEDNTATQEPTEETTPVDKETPDSGEPADDKKNESENTNVNTNKKDNTTASGKMPQTGAENIVFVIALAAVVGTIGFVKYRGLSDI